MSSSLVHDCEAYNALVKLPPVFRWAMGRSTSVRWRPFLQPIPYRPNSSDMHTNAARHIA